MDLTHYHQLVREGRAGTVRSPRALWRLGGPDRVRYLNGQVTNDVARLAVGTAIYAAVTSAKGRMVGDIFIGAAADALYVDADISLRDSLSARLERYLIADDAVWEDLTDSWTLTHVFGADAPPLPEPPGPREADRAEAASHEPLTWADAQARDIMVAKMSDRSPDLGGTPERLPSAIVDDKAMAAARAADEAAAAAQEWDPNGPADDLDSAGPGPVAANLPVAIRNPRYGLAGWDLWVPPGSGPLTGSAAAAQVADEMIELIRTEHGLARWGVDMDDSNLPPEALMPEERAISYTKGCYVGQEIIARLKSVGQVNKRLCVLKVTASPAGAGTDDVAALRGAALAVGDRDVGRITGAVHSPAAGGLLCLGYVNRHFGAEATLTASTGHTLAIVSPPLTPLLI